MTFDEWWDNYCKTHNYKTERDRCVAKITWQASRQQTIEECAEVAEYNAGEYASDVAAKIRDLGEKL